MQSNDIRENVNHGKIGIAAINMVTYCTIAEVYGKKIDSGKEETLKKKKSETEKTMSEISEPELLQFFHIFSSDNYIICTLMHSCKIFRK